MKSHAQIIEEKAMPLDGHQRQVLREYLEKGDKENNADYVYGVDEGEINKGNVREY